MRCTVPVLVCVSVVYDADAPTDIRDICESAQEKSGARSRARPDEKSSCSTPELRPQIRDIRRESTALSLRLSCSRARALRFHSDRHAHLRVSVICM